MKTFVEGTVRGTGKREDLTKMEIWVRKTKANGLPYVLGKQIEIRLRIADSWYDAKIHSTLRNPEVWISPKLTGHNREPRKLADVLSGAGFLKNEKVFLEVDGTTITVLKHDVGQIARSPLIPEEVLDAEHLREGAISVIQVNAYERNREAREQCLAHYGTSCCICGFSFEATYGEVAREYIHVHHLRELSMIGGEYVVDPVEDLRPVCPNCHAVLHLRRPAFSIAEVRTFLRQSGTRNSS